MSVEYQPWALFFGRLRPYKGLEYLMSACAMMGDGRSSAARIVVAGSGNLPSCGQVRSRKGWRSTTT